MYCSVFYSVPDPDLEMGGGEGGGLSSRPLDKSGASGRQKKFFFGPLGLSLV